MTDEDLSLIQKRYPNDPGIAELIAEFRNQKDQISRYQSAETRRYSKEKTKGQLILKMEETTRQRDQALRDAEELRLEILKLKGQGHV